jgi:hypothetical protein
MVLAFELLALVAAGCGFFAVAGLVVELALWLRSR